MDQHQNAGGICLAPLRVVRFDDERDVRPNPSLHNFNPYIIQYAKLGPPPLSFASCNLIRLFTFGHMHTQHALD
jgi:hypothetical protein